MKLVNVTGLLICAVLVGGSVKGGGATGWRLFSCWMSASTCTVLAAAPVSSMRKPVLKVGFTSLKAPPPYVKTALSKLQLEQFRPSSCCVRLGGTTVLLMAIPEIPGTWGTAPPMKIPVNALLVMDGEGDADCAQIDVWMPADMANAQQAPTINDPNVSVTLDIRPSQNGKDCSVWHYHYLHKGEIPPKLKFGNINPNLS